MRNSFRLLLLVFVIIFILMLSGCRNGTSNAEDDPILPPGVADEIPVAPEPFSFTYDDFPRMDGSPAMVPLAQALAAVMLGQSREEAVDRAMFTATANAYRSLADGKCDILLAGEPYPPVIDEILRRDFRFESVPIACDALVFIVSLSNPVDNLTSQQAKAIYSGQITGWQDVGGDALDITAFQRNEEALSQVLAERLIMNGDKMIDAPMQAIPNFYFYGDDTVPTAIRGFDGSLNAIGYTMYYYAGNMGMASGYKILSVDGVMPTPETIANGDYPFTNPYYAVISSDLAEDDSTRILFNWLLSDEGQDFIASQGYVPVSATALYEDIATNGIAPDMKWSVTFDSSALTPYAKPRSLSARLYDAALPDLVPFGGYGTLLPYSTAVTTNDGGIYAAKYGFVTEQSGTVVTDPIYDGISRATYAGQSGDTVLGAYRLHINLPDDDQNYGYRTVQAACASDGSWITPFLYENIVFRPDFFFLIYSTQSFDVDVYDYNGNRLYNFLELDWAERISDDVWQMMYSEGSGYGWVMLNNGTYALVDFMTGSMQETEFTGAYAFSDGLAAVVPASNNGSNLWGFVDESLKLVIPASFSRGAVFAGGQAVVETPDGEQHVIDKDGNVLFTSPGGFFLSSLSIHTGNYGYAAYSMHSAEYVPPIFYTADFKEIAYPPDALPLGPEAITYHLGYGYFLCMTESGVRIFNDSVTYTLPAGISHVAGFADEFIIFADFSDEEAAAYGVIDVYGNMIISAQSGQSVSPVFDSGRLIGFTVNVFAGSGSSEFIGHKYEQVTFKYVDLSGQSLAEGLGVLSYDEALGYLYVLGSDYFAWLNTLGDTFISIPSMAYSFD